MSAPAVAGAIARVRHRFPSITGMQAADLLKASGQPVSSLWVSANIPQPNLESAFRQATLPKDITASTATCGQINLSWTAPSIMAATEYRVRFASTAAGLASAAQTPLSNTVTSFSQAATQQQFYQVIAKDVTGDGVWSSPASATPTPCTPVQNIVIDGFTCTGAAYGSVRWSPVANAIRYDIEQVIEGNSFTGVPSHFVNTNSFLPITNSPIPPSPGAYDTGLKIRACDLSNACGIWSAATTYPIGGDICG